MNRFEAYRDRKTQRGYRQVSAWLSPDAQVALQDLRIFGCGGTAEIINTAIIRHRDDVQRERGKP